MPSDSVTLSAAIFGLTLLDFTSLSTKASGRGKNKFRLIAPSVNPKVSVTDLVKRVPAPNDIVSGVEMYDA
jgi:hypothetical protein